MGNLDRLLQALARQLPRSSDHNAIAAALKEAAKALPDSQAKTKHRLDRDEQECIAKLEVLLKEAPAEAQEAPVEVQEEALAEPQASAAYADIANDDPKACVARCRELLRVAVASIRPERHAEEALEGLMALLATGGAVRNLHTLVSCMQLLPTAAAALGCCSDSPVWFRFLGFLVATVAQLKKGASGKNEAAVQLGSLIALHTQHAPARALLFHTFSSLDEAPGVDALALLNSAVMPIVHVAFARIGSPKEVEMVRMDLAAALLSLRFMGLCRKASVGEPRVLNEAVDLLQNALAQHFDAAALLPGLQDVAPVASKKKRRMTGRNHANSRTESAKFVVEAVLSASATLRAGTITQLVNNSSGLSAGKEEAADRLAAAARARGELFFEDVSGGANALGNLDGVEALELDEEQTGVEALQETGVEDVTTGAEKKAPKKRKRASATLEA